jgi:3D (Asp-Asp-Asp) domain-containing protein
MSTQMWDYIAKILVLVIFVCIIYVRVYWVKPKRFTQPAIEDARVWYNDESLWVEILNPIQGLQNMSQYTPVHVQLRGHHVDVFCINNILIRIFSHHIVIFKTDNNSKYKLHDCMTDETTPCLVNADDNKSGMQYSGVSLRTNNQIQIIDVLSDVLGTGDVVVSVKGKSITIAIPQGEPIKGKLIYQFKTKAGCLLVVGSQNGITLVNVDTKHISLARLSTEHFTDTNLSNCTSKHKFETPCIFPSPLGVNNLVLNIINYKELINTLSTQLSNPTGWELTVFKHESETGSKVLAILHGDGVAKVAVAKYNFDADPPSITINQHVNINVAVRFKSNSSIFEAFGIRSPTQQVMITLLTHDINSGALEKGALLRKMVRRGLLPKKCKHDGGFIPFSDGWRIHPSPPTGENSETSGFKTGEQCFCYACLAVPTSKQHMLSGKCINQCNREIAEMKKIKNE